ncbi:MAG: DUF169 domain-containing protein [Candidatus Krumholzibacteria bacterium]|nr:DUF169 domain-containing protein [Candidatus Krumholzibacteria bacterium]
MEIIRKLESAIGGRWLGVSLYAVPVKRKTEHVCPQVNRFCETLKIASVSKVLIDPHQFTCPGARYAFGCGNDLKKSMIDKLVDKKGYNAAVAKQLIEKTPHCQDEIHAIGINTSENPGMYIAELQPMQAMRLVQIYQKMLEKIFQTEISSVLSACANVVVKAIQTQDMAISFGCDDSRASGSVSQDRLYAGLPSTQARTMMD